MSLAFYGVTLFSELQPIPTTIVTSFHRVLASLKERLRTNFGRINNKSYDRAEGFEELPRPAHNEFEL